MRRISNAVCFFLALLFLVPALVVGGDVSIRFSAGPGRVPVGDLNTFFLDSERYYDTLFAPYDFSKDGSLEELESFRQAAVEFDVDLFRHFGVFFGLGYLELGNEGGIRWESPDYGFLELQIEPGMSAVTISVGAYAAAGLAPRLKGYLRGSVGLYLFQGFFSYEESSMIEGWGRYDLYRFDVSGRGFGIHGAAGLDFALNESVSLFVEGFGRKADSGRLEGSMSLVSSRGNEADSGRLWYFEYLDPNTDQVFSGIQFGEKPSGGSIQTARPLKVDLSGLSVSAGFRIRLGDWF